MTPQIRLDIYSYYFFEDLILATDDNLAMDNKLWNNLYYVRYPNKKRKDRHFYRQIVGNKIRKLVQTLFNGRLEFHSSIPQKRYAKLYLKLRRMAAYYKLLEPIKEQVYNSERYLDFFKEKLGPDNDVTKFLEFYVPLVRELYVTLIKLSEVYGNSFRFYQ